MPRDDDDALARLLDNLMKMVTPIDFLDLERRGVLKPSREPRRQETRRGGRRA